MTGKRGNAACKRFDLSLELEDDDDGSHQDINRPGGAKSYAFRSGISNILLPRAPHRTGADEDSTAAFAPRALQCASADLLPGGPHHDELLAGGPHRAAAGSSSDGILSIADDRARDALLPEPLPGARASLRSDGIGTAPFESTDSLGEDFPKPDPYSFHSLRAALPKTQPDVDSSFESILARNKPDVDSSGSVDAPDEDRASPFDSKDDLGAALPKPDPYSFHSLRAALPNTQPDVDSSSESLLARNKTDVDYYFEALLAEHKPKDVNAFNALRASIPVTTFVGVDCDFVKPDPTPRPKHYEEYVANEWKKYVAAQRPITPEERRKMDMDMDDDDDEDDLYLVFKDPDSE